MTLPPATIPPCSPRYSTSPSQWLTGSFLFLKTCFWFLVSGFWFLIRD